MKTRRFLVIAVGLALALLPASCGVKGDPIPPKAVAAS